MRTRVDGVLLSRRLDTDARVGILLELAAGSANGAQCLTNLL